MYPWFRMLVEAFPLGYVLLFIVVLGGGYLFRDKIHDVMKDRTRGIQEIQQPSHPASKRAQYLPGEGEVVYTVSREDDRMMLI